MMNTKLALFVSVSAYALQINPVYASLLSSPPASILDTNIHTTTLQSSTLNQSPLNVILGLDPRIQVKQGFLSHLDASVKHWHDNSAGIPSFATLKDRLARNDNSFLTDRTMSKLLPPLSTREERGRLGNINTQPTLTLPCSPREGTKNASAGTIRTPVRIYAEIMKPLTDGVKLPQFAADTMPSNAFMPLATHSQLAPAGAPRQLASVCFITDTGACSGNSFGGGGSEEYPTGGQPDWNLDNNKRCRDEGYALTSCSSVRQPFNRCPYNSDIFEKCVCKPSLVSCPAGQVGVGDACGGKYASCQCDPKLVSCNALQDGQGATCGGKFERCTCKTSLKSCASPYKGIGSSCDGKYTECCNTCPEYTYTQASIPDGYVSGGSCQSCDGVKHKITPNPCTGFPTSCTCGYDTASASCKSGSSTRYKSCKKCCEPTCTSESSCKYGSITQSDGCGGTCTICKKNGDYHCADGSTVADASLCPTDGIIIREDDFCIIISKYQGYDWGHLAIRSTPSGWLFPSLSVMQKASRHINLINQQLNKIGEPNLLNTWYWTNTYFTDGAVYVINPYTGTVSETTGGGSGIYQAYYRYYKNCTN